MNLRTRLAAHLDPQHTPEAYARREGELLGKIMTMQDRVRNARPALLITAYEREMHALAPEYLHRAFTVQQVLEGRTRGLVILGYLPTNLALQHHRWRDAEEILGIQHVANSI